MDTRSVPGGIGYISGHRKGFRAPPTKDMGLMGQEGKHTSHKGLVRPPYGPKQRIRKEGRENERGDSASVPKKDTSVTFWAER